MWLRSGIAVAVAVAVAAAVALIHPLARELLYAMDVAQKSKKKKKKILEEFRASGPNSHRQITLNITLKAYLPQFLLLSTLCLVFNEK